MVVMASQADRCPAPGTNLNWRGRDGNDPSLDIAKDAEQRF
jgi:hypothetical protein